MQMQRKPYLNEALFQSILEQLKSGIIKPGDLLPSEKNLCEAYSMSRISVRKALDNLAASGFIVKRAGKGSFIRDDIKLPRYTQTGALGCLFCRSNFEYLSTGEFYGSIIMGIQEAAMRNQRSVIMEDYSTEEARNTYFSQKRYEKVDSIILLGVRDIEILYSLKALNIGKPICAIDFEHPENPFSSVNSENENGAYAATKHLLELGHRRIAFVGWKPVEANIALRAKGYQRALAEYGVAELMYYADRNIPKNGAFAARKLLAEHSDITAFVCANDGVSAISLEEALSEMGINVPEDISVTGYDNLARSMICKPPLTTVGFDRMSMGAKAVELVLDALKSGKRERTEIKVKTELIITNSTGCPKIRRKKLNRKVLCGIS